MKKVFLTAAIGACFSLPAFGDSTITMYGLLDTGVQISHFGKGTLATLSSGIADGSRLGFKGTEDLGGGYKTLFNLESRIEVDTGSNSNGFIAGGANVGLLANAPAPLAPAVPKINAMLGLNPSIVNVNKSLFDRTAYVGLVTPLGAVLAGRQYTPVFEVFAMADPFETGTAGGWGNVISGPSGAYTPGLAVRASNALQYRVVSNSGFGASLMYSPEKGTGSLNTSNRFMGANFVYHSPVINGGIAYNAEQDSKGNRSLRTTLLGGSYLYENVTFYAGIAKVDNPNPDIGALILAGNPSLAPFIPTITTNAKVNTLSSTLGMHYQMGNGRLLAGVSHTHNRLVAHSDVNLYSVGYDYNLSKRTNLYSNIAHASNQSNAQYALGGSGYSAGFTSQGGQDANTVQFGIRHKF